MTKQKVPYGRLPHLLMAGGAIGLFASFALTYDKIKILIEPSYIPSCNINPIFSCISVMATEQSMLLGVPNTIFGLIAFSALFVFGFMLLGGSAVKSWVWALAQAAATVGLIFMHYLFFQAVWRIGAICPWCFIVWMITIPIFWSITIYNLKVNTWRLGKNYQAITKFIVRHDKDVLVVWYAAIFLILLVKFWYYWSTLI